MKKIILISLLLISFNIFAQTTWVMQYTDNFKKINDVYFINPSTGYACCDSGAVIKTTNGGSSWITYHINTFDEIMRVRFSDALTGYAVSNYSASLSGGFGYIYKTINGGVNWALSNPNSLISPGSISLLGSDTLFISGSSQMKGGSHSQLYKSLNGGTTYSISTFQPKEARLAQITSKNALWWSVVLYSPTLHSKLVKSTDLGNTWSNVSINGDTISSNYSFHFINDNTGFLLKESSIVKTTNSGISWTSYSVPNSYLVQFINENTGWTGYSSSSITQVFKTTNSCISWDGSVINSQGYIAYIMRMFFINENTGWVAGSNFTKGCILKTTNGGVTFTNQNSSTIPDKFSLSQNYPNPFNPFTIINYQLTINSNVTLKIYDNLGNEVETLVNEKQNAGSYSVNFNGAELSSGIYFYKLNAGDFVSVKKMILVK